MGGDRSNVDGSSGFSSLDGQTSCKKIDWCAGDGTW